ncbi:unnamed protein product [Rotaria socialis]|uniref:Uncharacterized protein n=1 Tax=Rotaria socialis TaxID=392032 RepID=A0A820WRU5_9BILA|nr:unnamed protein product [Rotaria socialis]
MGLINRVTIKKKIYVYRGVKVDKENKGKLISTIGYLPTSRKESSALKPTKRLDVVSVLFHIQSDISDFNQYPREEVLFDLNACFLIESIEEHESFREEKK